MKSKHDFKCACCGSIFSYKTGTIFENSKVPMKKWFMAIYLQSAHKKGNNDDLVKYNKLQSSINSELSRGFIRKLTKDFADLGLIYLPNCSIIKRLWLKFKQYKEFKKISKFLPKENSMQDPMKYSFAYLLGSGELMLQWETVNTQRIHKSSIEKLKKIKQIILNLILKRKKNKKTHTSQAIGESIKRTL